MLTNLEPLTLSENIQGTLKPSGFFAMPHHVQIPYLDHLLHWSWDYCSPYIMYLLQMYHCLWMCPMSAFAASLSLRQDHRLHNDLLHKSATRPSIHDMLSMNARSSPPANSVQILFEASAKTNRWSVYFGPQGQAVDPCGVLPFFRFYPVEGFIGPGADIDQPPIPRTQTWAGLPDLDGDTACLILSDGLHPPVLRCGDIGRPDAKLTVGFEKDPGYHDTTIECADGSKHHRAYYAEYSA